ncbi:integrase [Gallibacterium anatis]|uniref:Integrase n=2 Tax=Gallibacterium anatis TaxID=750 RepID=U1I3Y1_9PAST|nr:tyrosine-type recombinase/integrase [Gallibacterium anatis]ERF78035.1 integrase [Gallibacterium anatis 12656/12]KGQ43559.1 integrase [Gallibacterium anatis]KGQ49394.1 integrase [Gallibacterium anatis]KGQ53153.1 integrase [Gallibacterium anatis]KGQ59656.1 integrase [Gallibacterium anatis]
MARPRKRENQGLPQNVVCHNRLRKKTGKVVKYYYYVLEDGKQKSLGMDKELAILEAAKLNYNNKIQLHNLLFVDVVNRYKEEVIPTKAYNTQNSNLSALRFLLKFFKDAPLDQIEPKHIKQYLDWRKSSPTSANNEITLFHHIWAMAKAWGYTKFACPSEGIKKHKIKARDVYIEDYIYDLVYRNGDQEMKDLMDIAYLTAQRPIDVVNIHSSHIYDGILHITQQKTGTKLRILLQGKLADIIYARLENITKGYLFSNRWGRKLSRRTLTERFAELREKLIRQYPELEKELANFQFRDLRAKAGTDKSLAENEEAARKQLGHTSLQMTKRYIRKDKPIAPTK